MADFEIGDIIQITDGPAVRADLLDKYFIVRAIAPEVVLSWPYVDTDCTILYNPRDMAHQSERDWRAQCESIERREKRANAAVGAVLRRVTLH